MRIIINSLLLVLLCIGISGAISSGPGVISYRGYMTFGDHVIALPELLKIGDRIIISDMQGTSVFTQTVNKPENRIVDPYLSSGFYTVQIVRNGLVLKSVGLPFKAR